MNFFSGNVNNEARQPVISRMQKVNIFWFRRDLRLSDNAGLYQALKTGDPVLPIFIFDSEILDKLENKEDRRVEFIYNALGEINDTLSAEDTGLAIFHDKPVKVFNALVKKYNIGTVFTNTDYEGYARERDNEVRDLLRDKGIGFNSYKDHVIFEKDQILKQDGKPYTVYTPYSLTWKAALTDFHLEAYPTEEYFGNFLKYKAEPLLPLKNYGFKATGKPYPPKNLKDDLLHHYQSKRNFPGIPGTSRMGIHLRFGTVSIRQLATRAREESATYLNELIWRDFYQAILWHFPHVSKGKSFKPAYDLIRWRNNEKEFEAWCEGKTGFPIVDAGMRELNETGFMHNRVRMITASFLCKDLLIDWRWGEAYFAEKLLDYDLAANNGGWQWAAGSGCDAAPYFRIFNPELQQQKFDKKGIYIRQWIPEFDSISYPAPIVDHKEARLRCLSVYKDTLQEK